MILLGGRDRHQPVLQNHRVQAWRPHLGWDAPAENKVRFMSGRLWLVSPPVREENERSVVVLIFFIDVHRYAMHLGSWTFSEWRKELSCGMKRRRLVTTIR